MTITEAVTAWSTGDMPWYEVLALADGVLEAHGYADIEPDTDLGYDDVLVTMRWPRGKPLPDGPIVLDAEKSRVFRALMCEVQDKQDAEDAAAVAAAERLLGGEAQ